jgi:hypothetical protein
MILAALLVPEFRDFAIDARLFSVQRQCLTLICTTADFILLSFHELQFEPEFSVFGHFRYFAGDDPLQPEPLTIHAPREA